MSTYADHLKIIRSEVIHGLLAGVDAVLKDLHKEYCNLNNIKNSIETSVRSLNCKDIIDIAIPLQSILTPLFLKYIFDGYEHITADHLTDVIKNRRLRW